MAIHKMIVIKGINEALDYFMDQIILAIEGANIKYHVIDVADKNSYDKKLLDTFISEDKCIVFMFNNIGLSLEDENGNYWKNKEVRLLNFLVDHPWNFKEYFENPIENMEIIVLDRYHKEFIEKYYGFQNKIYFIPNGGNSAGIINDKYIPYSERKIDIFYGGSCQPEVPLKPIMELEDKGYAFYNICFQLQMEYIELPIEKIIEQYCVHFLEDNDKSLREKLIFEYGPYLLNMIRRYTKLNIMHTLESTGACIHIYGKNWEDKERPWNSNVKIHERVTSEQCLELIGQSKISLNCMPWFKDGSSERVFNSMLNGAVCLTDINPYLSENFKNGEDIVFYSINDLKALKENVVWLLENPQISSQIAENGYMSAQIHTWSKRFELLNSLIDF